MSTPSVNTGCQHLHKRKCRVATCRKITFKKLSFVVLILSPQFDLRKLYLSVLVFVSEVCQHLYLSCPIELVKPCGQGTSGRHRCKNGQKAGGRDHQRRTSSEKTLFFSKLFYSLIFWLSLPVPYSPAPLPPKKRCP